jgi:hypothetical protein
MVPLTAYASNHAHYRAEAGMITLKFLLYGLASLLLVGAGLIWYGQWRWGNATQQLVTSMQAARLPLQVSVFNAQELEGLPIPVQRFFRAAMREGQPMIAAVHMQHTGMFNMGEQQDQWKPFTSTQDVDTRPPGFVWNGAVAMLPGVSVRVHDAYVRGQGLLHPAVLGLFSLTKLQGTGDIAQGEFLRYLAEAAWYPTALLPNQGVRWEAVDDHSARAYLADGPVSANMLFRFGGDHLIESIYVQARGRTVGNAVVMTPWEGKWSNYAEQEGGLRVPMQGEVAWLTPEGRKPYWRGTVKQLRYTFSTATHK